MNRSVPNDILLEICAVSLDYAIAAQRAGANRLELCSDLACGGVTPDLRLMEAAREHLQIPIQVLIRPRAGDFCYSADEFRRMREDIQNAKDLKMDGVVVGVLEENARVDVARTRELVEFAHPLSVTFHRAFDETQSWRDSLEAVIQTGAQRLLTSGCSPKVAEGLPTLTRLVSEARDRIIIMPGGGVTPANVVRVVRATSVREVHGSLLTPELSKTEEGANRIPQTELYYHQVLKVVSLLRSIASEVGAPDS
jgi:copper homeostasis protein